MTAATARRSGRGGFAPAAPLLAVAAAAWALSAQRMSGMDPAPGGELGAVGWFAVTWVVMMAAMMLPAVTPVAVVYGSRASGAAPSAAFVAGYLVAWVAVGLTAYMAIEGMRSLEPAFLAWEQAGRYAAAVTILVAALYQLTPVKIAFLRRCREPIAFVEQEWRSGTAGPLLMGARYGGSCIGCCWALTAALFALGVMNLTWMAIVAALTAAERLLAWNARLAVAVVLLALALGVGLAPDAVPGLAVPGGEMRMG